MQLTEDNFLRLSTHEADKAINRRCRVGNFDDVGKRHIFPSVLRRQIRNGSLQSFLGFLLGVWNWLAGRGSKVPSVGEIFHSRHAEHRLGGQVIVHHPNTAVEAKFLPPVEETCRCSLELGGRMNLAMIRVRVAVKTPTITVGVEHLQPSDHVIDEIFNPVFRTRSRELPLISLGSLHDVTRLRQDPCQKFNLVHRRNSSESHASLRPFKKGAIVNRRSQCRINQRERVFIS